MHVRVRLAGHSLVTWCRIRSLTLNFPLPFPLGPLPSRSALRFRTALILPNCSKYSSSFSSSVPGSSPSGKPFCKYPSATMPHATPKAVQRTSRGSR